jgi:hypothetical protein
MQPAFIQDAEKFDGNCDKLHSFTSHLCMKLVGNTSCFPSPQHQLGYTFGLLVGQAFTQDETYITNDGINLGNIPTHIAILEMAFGDPNCVAIAERKLEALKQINHNFFTYYAKFQCYALNV